MTEISTLQAFESIPNYANNDSFLRHKGRYLNAIIKISIGQTNYLMEIREGVIFSLSKKIPLYHHIDISIKSDEENWRKFWEEKPQAGWHDIFSLVKKNIMQIEGDSKIFFTNLQFIKELLEIPRKTHENHAWNN